jgi:hypothetical protein
VAPSDHRRLIAEIVAAQDAEARARTRVAKMGRHIVELLARARTLGLSDQALARALLRRRHGKVTLAMRRREVERLRKRRGRGTRGPSVSPAPTVAGAAADVKLSTKETAMSKLLKRTTTTTTEEFGVDEEKDAKVECADDAAEGDEEDAEEDEDEDDEEEDEAE